MTYRCSSLMREKRIPGKRGCEGGKARKSFISQLTSFKELCPYFGFPITDAELSILQRAVPCRDTKDVSETGLMRD